MKVRKHRAPEGALRRVTDQFDWFGGIIVRKHRAPEGALRLVEREFITHLEVGQKAPSARRCIKTTSVRRCPDPVVRCQKAPSAKRCIKTGLTFEAFDLGICCVRKHRAPKGALRRGPARGLLRPSCRSESTERQKVHQDWRRGLAASACVACQKAPSAKRCIMTNNCLSCQGTFSFCQKAPSTKRRIKTHPCGPWPASTRGQKAPSAKRCIKTDSGVAQSVVEVSQKAPSTPKSRMQFP